MANAINNKYEKENVSKVLPDNLKTLVEDSEKSQKDFAEMMGISPAALSLYMNGKQLPTMDFLIALKAKFQYISIDKLLFGTIPSIRGKEITVDIDDLSKEIFKFKGSYYLCYIDTGNSNKKSTDSGLEQNANLKWGVLYISDRLNDYGDPTFKCILVMGIGTIEETAVIKQRIDELERYEDIYSFASVEYRHKIYLGEFDIRRTHESVYVSKISDDKDTVLILLRSLVSRKDVYFGGIGAVNSISTGKETDPIIQKIVLSRDFINISEAQIRSVLLFEKPKLDIRNMPETKNLMNYVKEVYSSVDSAYTTLQDHEKDILFTSYLEYFAKTLLENNLLWCGRVDKDQDDIWYHMVVNSEDEAR